MTTNVTTGVIEGKDVVATTRIVATLTGVEIAGTAGVVTNASAFAAGRRTTSPGNAQNATMQGRVKAKTAEVLGGGVERTMNTNRDHTPRHNKHPPTLPHKAAPSELMTTKRPRSL